MFLYRSVLLSVLTGVLCCLDVAGQGRYDVDSLLHILDKEISRREIYLDRKLDRIDSLRSRLQATPPEDLKSRYALTCCLGQEYGTVTYDSTSHYLRMASELAWRLGDGEKIADTRLRISSLFLSGGVFTLAQDSMRLIVPEQLSTEMRKEYYSLSARLHYDIASYISDNYYTPLHVAQGNRLQDKLISLEEPGTDDYYMALAKRHTYDHHYAKTIEVLVPLLARWGTDNSRFPILGSTLSFCYRSLGRTEDAKAMLIMAVISDIVHAKMESTTAMQLAEMFYREKNLDRAHQSIELAQKCADYYNARHRKVRISRTLPLIETERILLEQDRRDKARVYAVVISSLAVAIALFLIIIYIQLRRLRATKLIIQKTNRSLESTNMKLRESNAIKEKYIVDFLTSYADFIGRTDGHQKILRKKLRERSYNDVMRLLNSEIVEGERQELFRRFDTIFLSLFPSFVEDFNALLTPGDEIVPKKTELLNTELRIYALMRLGIVDPSAVAKFLHCSLNTIYSYKARINTRARAEDKKDFEKSIMKIGMVIED